MTDDALAFWDGVGIDPISVSSRPTLYTLRCYFGETAAFLGSAGRIEVFSTERALAAWLAEEGAAGHDLARAKTWPRIIKRAKAGDLEIVVDSGERLGGVINYYDLDFVAELLDEGSCDIDIETVALAREVLTNVAQWAGDDKSAQMLAASHPLGQLLARLSQRTPEMAQEWTPTSRIPPRESIATEAAQFRELMNEMRARFRVHHHPSLPWAVGS